MIDNAFEAIEQSGKGDKIILSTYVCKDSIKIQVTDNGPGIPKEIKEKLLREHIKSNKGRGLGLLYSRGAALQYGGDLYFQNLKAGTSFTLMLPFVKK